MMLNQTEEHNLQSNLNREEENEAGLDDVWNNFNENQFDDFDNYNNEFDYQNESKEKVDFDNSVKSNRVVSDEELADIVLNENSKEKSEVIPNDAKKTKASAKTYPDDDDDSSIDYDELEFVLNNVEENHAASQRQKSFPNSETTPICLKNDQKLKNKNLIQVQNQRVDLDMSALTPMPSYSTMDTPNLRDNLKKFGIKV